MFIDLLGFIFELIILFTIINIKEHSYRQGQIDAIQGKIHYKATTQTVFERVE